MEREPLGLNTWASHPAVTSDARQAGDRSSNTDLELHLRHRRPPLSAHSTRATSCRTPGSEYYGGSAPSRTDRSTMDPAQPSCRMHDRRAGTETVPVFTVDSLDEGGAQLCPCGIATATPQHFTVASGTDIHMPTPKFPAETSDGCAPHPAHIRQIGAGEPLRDVPTLVPLVLLFVTLAEPTPSGSTGPSRLCRGCSHPLRHLPEHGCPQLHRPATTGRRRRSLTSTQIVSASRRTWIRAQPTLRAPADCFGER